MTTQPIKINLQLFPEEPTSGAIETFEWEDPHTHEKILMPEKVKVGDKEINIREKIGHMNSGIRKVLQNEITKKSEAKYQELQTMLNDKNITVEQLQSKIQEFEESKMSMEEQIKAQSKREIDMANNFAKTKEQEAITNYNLFQETKIDNDIYGAFSGFSLSNAEDTKLLIRQKGNAKVVKDETTGQFKTVLTFNVDGEAKELTPKEAVELYLADPNNSHHLKNNLRAGGGSVSGGKATKDGKIGYTRSSMNDPATRAEYNAKNKKGEPVAIIEG